METFQDLFDWIQTGKSELVQIYSSKRQVNVLNFEDLSIMNILFVDGKAKVYTCVRPGIANYDGNPAEFEMTDKLTSIKSLSVYGPLAYTTLLNISH